MSYMYVIGLYTLLLAFIFVRTYNCLALFTMFYKRFRFLKIFNFCFRILCLFGVFFDVTFFKDFCSFGLCNYLFRIPNKAAHALLHMPLCRWNISNHDT